MKLFYAGLNNRGQAAAELAILGILLITAFSYIMNFGQALGAAQQNKMETFRLALQKAYIRNGSATYTLKKDERAASVNTGFFQGQALSPQATSSVTWQKGRAGDPQTVNQGSFAFWQINETEVKGSNPLGSDYGLPMRLQDSYNADGSKNDYQTYVPASVYKNNEVRTETYSFNENKNESYPGINYHKVASLNDSASGQVYIHFNDSIDTDPADDSIPTPQWSNASSLSYSVSTNDAYDKSWYTPHDGSATQGIINTTPFYISTPSQISCIQGGGYWNNGGCVYGNVGGDLAAQRDAQREALRSYNCSYSGGSYQNGQCVITGPIYSDPADWPYQQQSCTQNLHGQWTGNRCVYSMEAAPQYNTYNTCFSHGGQWDGASCFIYPST
jgi:hypothetical protein